MFHHNGKEGRERWGKKFFAAEKRNSEKTKVTIDLKKKNKESRRKKSRSLARGFWMEKRIPDGRTGGKTGGNPFPD